MRDSRRRFLQSTMVAGAGWAATFSSGDQALAQSAAPPAGQTLGTSFPASLLRASELQVSKVRFGNVEISRVVTGCNQFYGFAHFNNILGTVMREWYTTERVCEVLHQCNRFGINAFNYLHRGRAPADLERFRAEGGQMHLIVQGQMDPQVIVSSVKPLAIYHHGDLTDDAFKQGKKEIVREYCKQVRQTGALVGVGTHNPQVIATVEEEGWDVDFYAGCVYNRTRTAEEFRKLLGGELPVAPNEVYLESDPPRMYAVMRQTKKPCFAFKILAAGRIDKPQAMDQAYRTAFQSIKPSDCIFVGMFPRVKDEVRDNAERVHRILAGS